MLFTIQVPGYLCQLLLGTLMYSNNKVADCMKAPTDLWNNTDQVSTTLGVRLVPSLGSKAAF